MKWVEWTIFHEEELAMGYGYRGKIRVAQTGLAGMNRVRFANITNNLGHFNGRN